MSQKRAKLKIPAVCWHEPGPVDSDRFTFCGADGPGTMVSGERAVVNCPDCLRRMPPDYDRHNPERP